VPFDAFNDLGFGHCCFAHSCDGWDEHVLLLLHGFGDADVNFAAFGAKLQLPQTAVLAVRAPIPMLDMGFTWFDVFTESGDVCFDSIDAIASLRETSAALLPLLQRVHTRHGYALRNMFMLGYSQGGTIALGVAQALGSIAIGGIVSICGAPPPPLPKAMCSSTPILFTLGERDVSADSKSHAWSQFQTQWRSSAASSPQSSAAADELHDCVMLHVAGKAEAMVQGEDETRALMQFFGRHLKLRSLQLCVCAPPHRRRAFLPIHIAPGMRSRMLSASATRALPPR
jgi:predicted esterase